MAFSVNSPIGDGVTTQFAVSFTNGLYSRDNVHVFVGDETTERAFTWINDGLIDVQGTVPAVGEVVTIRRIMDKTNKAVDFADGEILDERNLDTMVDQLYNISHEFLDGYGLTEVNVDIDMRGNSLTNVGGGDPNDPGSLATIGDLQSAIVSPEDLVDAVRISNNFSDLDDTAVCRTNLDVYSKAEVNEVTQANANILINGDFQVWQRGTSFTTPDLDAVYTADRWLCDMDTDASDSGTISRQPFTLGQTDVPSFPSYYFEYNCTTGLTGNSTMVRQRIEDVVKFGSQTFTLSYYAKADKAITTRVQAKSVYGDGSTSSNNTALDVDIVLGTSWQKFEHTFTTESSVGKDIQANSHLEINFIELSSAGNGAFFFDLANVKLEHGSVSTPFEVEPYGDVLLKCQRYFFKFNSGTSNINVLATVWNSTSTSRAANYQFPTAMRTDPTLSNITDNGFWASLNTTAHIYGVRFDGVATAGGNSTSVLGFSADAEL